MSDRVTLLTPPGAGAIAVVRLAGPQAAPFLETHFSRPLKLMQCVHGELRDGDRVIDDPIVVLLDASRADGNLHGGPWVVQSFLDLTLRAGFLLSDADEECTDGSSLIEREMLAALPLARTELGLRALLAQPAAWDELLKSKPSREVLDAMLVDRSLWWLLHPPRVAIVGSPNVGKSTLANQLFGQARSITADQPGTTRDWVGEIADIEGLPVMLLDTPGVRTTDDPVERAAIARAAAEATSADLVIQLLDVTMPLPAPIAGAMRIANKCDLPKRWDANSEAAVRIVAIDDAGVDGLRRAVTAHFGCADLDVSKARWWTEPQRKRLAAIA